MAALDPLAPHAQGLHGGPLRNIGTDTEGAAARTRQDHHANIAVCINGTGVGFHLIEHLKSEGVELGLAVEGNDAHVVSAFDVSEGLIHGLRPCFQLQAHRCVGKKSGVHQLECWTHA